MSLNQEHPPSASVPPAAQPETGVAPANEDQAAAFADVLGIPFTNLDHLRTALIHRSVVHDPAARQPGLPPFGERQSNERLEFLGDAILGYIAADVLYHVFPDAPEGVLTSRRVALVRAEQLVQWAREIDLPRYLYLGQGEKVSNHPRDRILAGALEAVIAAITLDGGMDRSRDFLRHFANRDAARIFAGMDASNPKGRLQEVIQETYRLPPVYRTIHAEGPAHDRTFTVEVMIDGRVLAEGAGSSKREAEQAAAAAALAAMTG